MIPILLVTPQLLVIDKPAGLPVHSGAEGNDVLGMLAAGFPGEPLAAVHRLDAATSGCLLVARLKPAFRVLARAFAMRRVEKTYLALVRGIPNPEHGEIFTHIAPHGPGSPRMTVVEPGAGPTALTLYHTLGVTAGNALLELRPITGRTHQLRVHLRHLGHPILGDPLYGMPGDSPHPRLMLHAWRLSFPDPGQYGRALHVLAPIPGGFPLPGD